jgi:hypothetical protein
MMVQERYTPQKFAHKLFRSTISFLPANTPGPNAIHAILYIKRSVSEFEADIPRILMNVLPTIRTLQVTGDNPAEYTLSPTTHRRMFVFEAFVSILMLFGGRKWNFG